MHRIVLCCFHIISLHRAILSSILSFSFSAIVLFIVVIRLLWLFNHLLFYVHVCECLCASCHCFVFSFTSLAFAYLSIYIYLSVVADAPTTRIHVLRGKRMVLAVKNAYNDYFTPSAKRSSSKTVVNELCKQLKDTAKKMKRTE